MFKLILIFLFVSASAFALPTSEVRIPAGARVAIMTGTYSPPHRRHHEIFEQLLASGLVDYVLVIPNDVTPHKPHALNPKSRLEMLEAGYKNHPRILYPHDLDVGFPLASKTKTYLDRNNPGLEWVGVMGKDSTHNPWANFGARFQNVVEWLVLTPDQNDESEIPKAYGKTKVTRLYAPTDNDVHSKEIRNAAANDDIEELEKLLLPEVAHYVVRNELYRAPEPKARFMDYLRSCKNILVKAIR